VFSFVSIGFLSKKDKSLFVFQMPSHLAEKVRSGLESVGIKTSRKHEKPKTNENE